MSKIIELSETLANQIAAGEVVERPSSVVKELVENAIDANSTQIDIYLEEAGLRKIQIIDNGDGIENEDVLNAFKRHATSKIHSRDDLFRIKTLGFRGEALPSIASVSEIIIETSTGNEEGRLVKMSGGKVSTDKPHSLRKGTKLTVENLFFNTPARLKYVRTLQTELSNIGDMVNRLALSHPEIAFRLIHDGNQMLATAGNGDLKQTLAGIYGVATAKKMMPINQADLDFKVTGFVSLPEVTRASRNYISLIINGRYIKNYLLNKAIVDGYGSKLMIGRFPIAVIKIDMDPLLVDVNVHPTKQEVRLSKEPELTALISKGIRLALEEQQLIPKVDSQLTFNKEVKKEVKLTQPTISESLTSASEDESKSQGTLHFNADKQQFFVDKQEPEREVSQPAIDTHYIDGGELAEDRTVALDKIEEPLFDDPFTSAYHVPTEPSETLAEVSEQQGTFPELEYFGQMHGTYLFAQSSQGLYILDQHAAQERIKYEYFREKIGEVGTDLQELLVPIVLEYPQSDSLKIKEHLTELADVGIHLEEFGQSSYLCRAHPTWYPQGTEEEIIREMVELVRSGGKLSVAKFREDTAIMMSCKQSIKANHFLNETQARQLLVDLAKCENPYNCPHGRPVLVHFDNKDMEKMFKRIQDSH